MFTYSAICDVPIETLDYLTGLLHRHRRTHDLRPFQRAGTARTQAKGTAEGSVDTSGVVVQAAFVGQ